MIKKIAIIGSGSYIASHFYNSIDQHDVSLFSRSSSGKKGEVVKDLFDINCDDLKDIDVVINFAAKVHQPNSKSDAEFIRVNKELPIQLAHFSREASVKHFIQMSSLSVYGDVTSCNVESSYNPVGTYGRSKMEADDVLLDMICESFKVTVVRSPMVYGGGLSPGNMQKIVRMAMRGWPFPMKNIHNKRDFIHVSNLVLALRLIVDKQLGGVFLPTDKQAISTEDIIDFTAKFSRGRVRKVIFPEMARVLFSKIKPNLYQKIYGDCLVTCNMPASYQPKFKLEDGIRDLVHAIEKE